MSLINLAIHFSFSRISNIKMIQLLIMLGDIHLVIIDHHHVSAGYDVLDALFLCVYWVLLVVVLLLFYCGNSAQTLGRYTIMVTTADFGIFIDS